MKKIRQVKIDYYLLGVLILGLAPILWFRSGLMIAGGDESWLINPLGFTPDVFYAWNEKLFNFGGPNIYLPYTQTVIPFWQILNYIGVNGIVIQKIWIVFLFMLPGLSMYFLVKTLFHKIEYVRLAAFFSSLLYVFNIYIIQIGPFQTNTKLVLIALPLVLMLYIKGLEKNRQKFLYAFPISLVMTFIGSSFVNIAVVSIIPIILLIYLLYFVAKNKNRIFEALLFTLLIIFLWLIINSYWLIPYVQNMLSFNQSSGGQVFNFEQLDTKQFFNFWRFLGSWGWKETHNFQPYFPFAYFYDRFPLVFLSYIPAVIAIFAIAVKRNFRYVLYFALLLMVGIFLSKGSTEPFGSWYEYLFRHFHFLWIFREPWAKFTPIHLLAISILFGLGSSYLIFAARRFKIRSIFTFSFLFFAVLLTSYPLITGGVVSDRDTGLLRSNHVKIPEYWSNMNEFIKNNTLQNDRIMLMPPTGYAVGYKWQNGFFAGDTPALVLLDRPTIRYTSFPTSKADLKINNYYELLAEQPEKIEEISKELGLKYILLDRDIMYDYSRYLASPPKVRERSSQIASQVSAHPKTSKIFEAGSLELYKIGNDEGINPILNIRRDGELAKTEFEQISPSRYVINDFKFEDESTYTLRLNNSYNALWEASICKEAGCTKVGEDNHRLSDDYANSWELKAEGIANIILEYSPQAYLDRFAIPSRFVLLVLIGLWLTVFYKTRSKSGQQPGQKTKR